MDVKITKSKIYDAVPSYSKQGDAGIDLKADSIISQNDYQIVYGTGISIEVPPGYVALIFPRSSIRNTPLIMANSVGVIDSGYRGEIQVTFLITDSTIENSSFYQLGDRICQLLILPYPQINLIPVKRLSDSVRGNSGHGSTGK